MINLTLLGQPLWCNRLADTLNRRAGRRIRATAVGISEFLSAKKVWAIKRADILMRVGYRPGAATLRGRCFELLWHFVRCVNPNARVIHYWIGSDVANAVSQYRKSGLGTMAGRRTDHHWAVASWLVSELASIGITADMVMLPNETPAESIAPCVPEEFRILTYLPEGRHEFYGSAQCATLAKMLPHVEFDVLAGEGRWLRDPLPNMHFLGWRKDAISLMNQSFVYLRITSHDGLPASVKEAMTLARHVFCTVPLPYTNTLAQQNVDAAAATIRSLFDRFAHKQLDLNYPARAYALAHFDPTRNAECVADSLANVLSVRNVMVK